MTETFIFSDRTPFGDPVSHQTPPNVDVDVDVEDVLAQAKSLYASFSKTWRS